MFLPYTVQGVLHVIDDVLPALDGREDDGQSLPIDEDAGRQILVGVRGAVLRPRSIDHLRSIVVSVKHLVMPVEGDRDGPLQQTLPLELDDLLFENYRDDALQLVPVDALEVHQGGVSVWHPGS